MNTVKILIAEGSADVRSYLVQGISVLEGAKVKGYSGTSESILEKVGSEQPQIVVLDPALLGAGAKDIVRRIKTLGNPPVVIVLTNFVSGQYRKRAMEQGADHFFDKSFEFEQALATVRELVVSMSSVGSKGS